MFAGVGERTREGNDLYREMIESGVIKLGEKQVKTLHFTCHPLSTHSSLSAFSGKLLLTCSSSFSFSSG